MESTYDDYDLEDYYDAIARALERIPNSSAVIKLRPGSARESFYRSMVDTIFARVPHTTVQYEPFPELFASADMVVSDYSTVVLEALQFNKPTIVFNAESGGKKAARFHFAQYAEAGGLIIADTPAELEIAFRSIADDIGLRARLAEGAERVLARFFLFDGKASERIIGLIERLSRKQK